MNDNQKEVCPIEYMIASRRPKKKQSKTRCLKNNKAIIQKMLIVSGAISALTVGAIYSSALCDMAKKMLPDISMPKVMKMPKTASVDERTKMMISASWDSDFINERYKQEAQGKDYYSAVQDALYSLWRQDDMAAENGKMSNEEYSVRAEQRYKRSCQFQRLDWSNVDLDTSGNPFVNMILKERQDETHNEVSCIRKNTSISQNNKNLHIASRENTR